MTRNDAAFYVNSSDPETVWQTSDCDFYVVRAGEMRVRYKPDTAEEQLIRYTDQLFEVGINDDGQLDFRADDGLLDWIHNSWFEVWNKTDSHWCSDPFHDLEEAILYAQSATLKEE